MKIEQLTVENFKCFKREQTFDFPRLTILTGANSSGKSSVMFGTLIGIQSQGFPKLLNTNGEYVELGDFKEIVNNHDSSKSIKLNLSISSANNRLDQFNTEWKQNETNFLPINTKAETKIQSPNSELKGKGRPISPYRFGQDKTNYIGAFRQPPKRTNLEQSKTDFKIDTQGQGYIDQIVEWEKRSNGKIKELVRTMKELDLIEDIKTNRLTGGRFELLVKATTSSVMTSLSNVGFGISQFLPIIVADLQLPNDSTLFLAEPEIHLHPSVQAKFGDYLVDKIAKTEKNYFIETHSEYFLNRIRLAIVKGDLKREDVKIYFLENNADDTNVHDVDFTKTGAIRNAPPNFFRTYFLDTMDIALNSFAE